MHSVSTLTESKKALVHLRYRSSMTHLSDQICGVNIKKCWNGKHYNTKVTDRKESSLDQKRNFTIFFQKQVLTHRDVIVRVTPIKNENFIINHLPPVVPNP